MHKIYSRFYLDIYRIKNDFDNLPNEDVASLSLKARIRSILNNWDEEQWSSLQKYYYASCSFLNGSREKLVFILFLDIYKDRLKKYSFQIIKSIIEAFIYTNVNPYNYESYLALFFSDKVYDLLLYANLFEHCHPLNSFLSVIIYRTHLSDLNRGYYDTAVKILSDATSSNFSPLLGGNYDVLHIHQVLATLMQSLNQSIVFFSENNFKTLDAIQSFPTLLSPSLFDNFINNVIRIEADLAGHKVAFVRAILKQIELFTKISKTGIHLVRSTKKQESVH